MNIAKGFLLSALTLFISSCGFLGIHFKDHNPRHQSTYPKFSKETILLGEDSKIRSGFDVTHYGLDIEIQPEKKSLNGWVAITSLALSPIDSVQLDLASQLMIDSIVWETRSGKSLLYKRKYRGIFIQLPENIQSGQAFTIHVKYHGKPVVSGKPPWKGGTVWKKDKDKKNWDGVVCETEGASIWFPCKDINSDEPDSADMRFSIQDTSVMVVSNGVFKGEENNGTLQSYNWKVSYPINLYDITFYVGAFRRIEDRYNGINGQSLALNYYVLKPDFNKAVTHFRQVKHLLKTYEEIYGEYPWYRDGYKLVEAPYAGMEHQTAIAYGNEFKNSMRGKDDYIMVHESGHEWFGNAVTAADLADVWIQEGITTYGEFLYLEKAYPTHEQDNFFYLFTYRLFIKNKFPIVGPRERKYFDYHDADCYMKAAWMLHTLRKIMNNDTLFMSIIRTFYQNNKMKVTDSKTFIKTVNTITGKDFNWFFNQYLYYHKVPMLEYENGFDGYLYYRWVDVVDGFDKMNITLEGNNLDSTYTLIPDKRVQRFKLPDGVESKEFSINRSQMLFGVKSGASIKKIYRKENDLKRI